MEQDGLLRRHRFERINISSPHINKNPVPCNYARDRKQSCGATQVAGNKPTAQSCTNIQACRITGAEDPLTATHLAVFGHPQKSIHIGPEYRLSAKWRLSAKRIKCYLLFLTGLTLCCVKLYTAYLLLSRIFFMD